MAKTRVFVSSTCYDLGQVREDIRECLLGLGHEPLLSEYPSFPVVSSLDTIENCRRNVREHSDLLVLIVGGNRGSLDPKSRKPITNLEYDEAQNQRIPVFVFVERSVWNVLELWKANPDGDFSAVVNDTAVFQFVETLKRDNTWVFTFERASRIKEILRIQLSILLRYLLDQARQGRLASPTEFSNESEDIRALVRDRPELWQYRLTEALLASRLEPLLRKADDIERGLCFRQTEHRRGEDLKGWLQARTMDLPRLIAFLKIALEEDVPTAWDLPSETGDPGAIKRAVDKIDFACNALLDWGIIMRSASVPSPMERLMSLMYEWGPFYVDVVEDLRSQLASVLRDPEASGTVNIKYVFSEPPNLDAVLAELELVFEDPSNLTD